MGMTAMDVETKNDAILEAGSKATINEEVLTRQAKVQDKATLRAHCGHMETH